MNQFDLREHLPAYADGELPDVLRHQVEAYLADSPAARAEVARWQALRRCARRSLVAEPLPKDLRRRIVERLARQRRQRSRHAMRIGVPLTAAALLTVAIIIAWPGRRAEAIPLVTAHDLARIYYHCGCDRHHDAFGLANLLPAQAAQSLRSRAEVDFRACVPDLSAEGYRLAGACGCVRHAGVRGVHVHYVRDCPAGEDLKPENVVSFFSMARRVRLKDCTALSDPVCRRRSGRQYSLARVGEKVTVLKWDECACSFAVCSELEQETLVALVDAVNVAALCPRDGADRVAVRPSSAYRAALAVITLLFVSKTLVSFVVHRFSMAHVRGRDGRPP